MSSAGGFPTLAAVVAVMFQAATGILPSTAPPAAPVAAVTVPALPTLAPLETFDATPDVGPIPTPRPKPVKAAARVRKHQRAVRPRSPVQIMPAGFVVSIRITL